MRSFDATVTPQTTDDKKPQTPMFLVHTHSFTKKALTSALMNKVIENKDFDFSKVEGHAKQSADDIKQKFKNELQVCL